MYNLVASHVNEHDEIIDQLRTATVHANRHISLNMYIIIYTVFRALLLAKRRLFILLLNLMGGSEVKLYKEPTASYLLES